MKSRVYPKYKTRYRVGNWAEYERALVQRGDVTLWLSDAAIRAWATPGVGKRRGQLQYSDLAIETVLTLRLIFHLPLRQTEGFVTSIFGLLGLDLTAPDHTTLSRRGQCLPVALRRSRRSELHLIVDSTGLSIVGEGEWAAAKHGARGRRGWRKLHLGVDGTGVIVAGALTDSTADDATTGNALVGQVDGEIARVTADTAYDTLAFYQAARKRGARVIVPPTRVASVSRRGPRSRSRGNGPSLSTFSFHVVHIWQKWLNRRSQKRAMPWKRFLRLLGRYRRPAVLLAILVLDVALIMSRSASDPVAGRTHDLSSARQIAA